MRFVSAGFVPYDSMEFYRFVAESDGAELWWKLHDEEPVEKCLEAFEVVPSRDDGRPS